MKGNMAGNKPTAKIKSNKEERIKGKKNVEVNTNSCDGSSSGSQSETVNDLSILLKSIPTNVVGFRQLKHLHDAATEEVQNLLANECDFIYECRVCRNMFRSIANFISHKRIYCKQKFNTTLHAHFTNTSFLNSDTTEIYNNNKQDEDYSTKSNNNKKDLTSIINKLGHNIANKKMSLLEYYDEINYRVEQRDALKYEHAIRLDEISNNKSAVYQTVVKKDDCDTNEEFILDEVIELHDMLWKDNAVMGPDGKLLALDSSGQIKSPKVINSKFADDEDEILKCDICYLEFKTRKTLLYHVKVRHSASHMHYPCPSCSDIFPSAGSVYRHLCKSHNNTMVTVRKLRDQILNRGFTIDNASKKMLHRLNKQGEDVVAKHEPPDESNSWKFDLELDLDTLCCVGCGRKFERKAALTSHQLICKNRTQPQNKNSTSLNKRTEDTSIEKNTKNSRKNKLPLKKVRNTTKNIVASEEIVSTGNDNLSESSDTENELSKVDNNRLYAVNSEDVNINENEQVLSLISDNEQKRNKRKRAHTTKITNDTKEYSIDPYWEINEQGSLNVKRSKTESNEEEEMKKKMFSLINEKKMQCIPCKRIFPSMTNLKRHIALHMKWKRFQCGLCCAQFYHRSECLYHLGRTHNMMGDKNVADTLIIPIHHKETESTVDKQINTEDEEIIYISNDKNKQLNDLQKNNIDLAIDEVVLKYTDPDSNSNCKDPFDHHLQEAQSNADIILEVKDCNNEEKRPVSLPVEEIKEENPDLAPVRRRGRPKLMPNERIEDDDNREKRGRGRPRGSFNKEKKKKIKKPKTISESPKSQDNDPQPQDSDKMRKMVLEVIFGGEKKEEKQEESFENKNETPSSPETDISCVSTDFEIKSKFEKSDDGIDKRSGRPVRNRVRVVNKDFVYDLSDLLKKEAEAYKESHYTSACNRLKKRVNSVLQLEDTNNKFNENINEGVLPENSTWENSFRNKNECNSKTYIPETRTSINDLIKINNKKECEIKTVEKKYDKKLLVPKQEINISAEQNYKSNNSVEDITVIPVNIPNNSADESSGSSDEMPLLEVNMTNDIDSNEEEMNDPLEESESNSDDSLCPDITETYKSKSPSPAMHYVDSNLSNVLTVQPHNKSEISNRLNRVYIRKSTGDLQEIIFESPIEANEESVIYESIVNRAANDSEYEFKTLEYMNGNSESAPLECNSALEDTSSEEESYDSDQ